MSNTNAKICNQQVYESVFKSYAKELKRFLYFKTRDMDLAEDLLQDAFVKLWDNCDKVDPEKVKSFLFTVANNLFLNYKKREKIIRNHRKGVTLKITNESPEFLMVEQEFLDKIEKAIADLPENQREVFLLSRIEKKKYKEIAEMLNLSVKAVEKRMHLALMTMKEKIGKV